MPRKPNVTDRSIFILKEIAAGRDRIYAFDARPPGAQALMQAGYAVRVGPERMELTSHGCAFLAGMARQTERSVALSRAELGELSDALGFVIDSGNDSPALVALQNKINDHLQET